MKMIWIKPTDDGGRYISQYKIYRGIRASSGTVTWATGSLSPYFTTNANHTVAIVDGLLRNVKYVWKITAINVVGEGPATPEKDKTSINTPDTLNLAFARPATQISDHPLGGTVDTNLALTGSG